ncbi:Panacea domain-containing protein [Zhenpiania hominis]|uniref:Panacea domain-containing protein n=1 Tax=Zhenpiania hominis TaxID=2763644 RepID=UPI0039F5A291
MANVFDVAAYILDKCGELTTMKLQKLVYYCQAWSLAWDDKPLFDEDFEAWANGPVCPELFRKHKGKFVVDKDFFNGMLSGNAEEVFDKDEFETMDIVIREYSDKTPQWLSDLTHSERPWKSARKGCSPGAYCDNVIDKEEMRQYYGGIIS